MVTKPEIRNRYPREIELDESLGTPGPSFMRVRAGGKPQIRLVPIRLMGATDRDSIVLFARHLPQEDLLFLHSDITQPAIVEEWLRSIENGATVTLLAEPDGTLEGYAINVAPEWQSRGLGEALCAEIIALGGILELGKITAQMVAEHKSARAMFERLGFRAQAFLPDWVEDQEGRGRDLLLMVHDVPGPERKAPASG